MAAGVSGICPCMRDCHGPRAIKVPSLCELRSIGELVSETRPLPIEFQSHFDV